MSEPQAGDVTETPPAEAPPAEAPAAPKRRTWIVWTLIVLAALIGLVSSLTIWVKRQALDTDNWTTASSELLEDDQIRAALSTYIVDQVYTNVDVSGELEQRLPSNLQGLAAPIAGALREPSERFVDEFLQRPRVQEAWERINTAAHRAFLAIVEGNPRPNVSTGEGTVTLDLRSFVVQVGTELGIGEQLDQRLPADAGQLTILQSDQLSTAQDAVKGVKALSVLLFIVTFVLWAAAVWLAAGWRRTALVGIGASVLIVGLILLIVRRAAGNYVVDALASGESIRDAAGDAWLISTTLLTQIAWALVLYGVALLVGCWLASPNRYAKDLRRRAAPTLAERPGLCWLILAVLFLLLVWWGPTPALRTLLGVVILGALVALGFEVLRRLVIAEHGAAQTEEQPAET